MMLVIFSEALGAGQTFAEKHRYRLDPNQEMIALGVANIGSGLLGGLASGGSLSQTAVNDGAGAQSEMSPIVAAGAQPRDGRSRSRRCSRTSPRRCSPR